MSGECQGCYEHCLDCKCKDIRQVGMYTISEHLRNTKNGVWAIFWVLVIKTLWSTSCVL